MQRRIWMGVLAALAAFAVGQPEHSPDAAPTAEPRFRVLVYSRTAGFRHESIPTGVEALRALGAAHNFAVDATEDPAAFSPESLAPYAAVVFLSTTGDVLDAEQERAFEQFIADGKGYVGIHAAADTEYEWPWYAELVGGYFVSHPAIQPATVVVEDAGHPSTVSLPASWERTDEWYNYRQNPRGDANPDGTPGTRVRVLLRLVTSSYEGSSMGDDHPIAWCREWGGGRAWYTGGGHTHESYAEAEFMAHVLGGIEWAAGATSAEGDAEPVVR